METAPRLYHVVTLPADRSVGVDAYFETLRKEHGRFLDAIGRARSLLDNESGQLAQVTAVQGQLTRQFLDAQRSIMKRRAEIDAEVAAIGGATPDVPVGAAAQRQLAALLDGWWHAENASGRAVVDAIRGTVRSATWEPPKPTAVAVEPLPHVTLPVASQVLDVLETADPADPDNLLSLLTALADSLERAPAASTVSPVNDLVIRLDTPPCRFPPPEITPEDAYRGFWDERSSRHIHDVAPSPRRAASRRVVKSFAAHVLLPMTVVTSVLVLLMAWIG